jgi:HEAT repeat protein
VLDALVRLGVPDRAAILQAGLADPDGSVRATAAKLAGEAGDPSLVPELGRILVEDPEPAPRQRCAESLARLGGDAAFEPLRAGMTDTVVRVRLAAVTGVGEIDPDRARDDLVRLMLEDPSWEVRAASAHALGGVLDPSAVVSSLETATADPNEYVRAAAASSLRGRSRGVGGSVSER